MVRLHLILLVSNRSFFKTTNLIEPNKLKKNFYKQQNQQETKLKPITKQSQKELAKKKKNTPPTTRSTKDQNHIRHQPEEGIEKGIISQRTQQIHPFRILLEIQSKDLSGLNI